MVLTSLFATGDKSGVAGTMAGMGFGFLIVGAALVLVGYLQKVPTEMAVTNKRIIIKAGLLSRRTFELLLSKVESIGVEEGVLGRMLGYGSVVVRGTDGTPEPFRLKRNNEACKGILVAPLKLPRVSVPRFLPFNFAYLRSNRWVGFGVPILAARMATDASS
jgi:Bacterial PH domain